MKNQASAAEKQYQKLYKVLECNKKEEEKILKGLPISNLGYSKKVTFHKYHNTKEVAKCSFYSKQNDLRDFKDLL